MPSGKESCLLAIHSFTDFDVLTTFIFSEDITNRPLIDVVLPDSTLINTSNESLSSNPSMTVATSETLILPPSGVCKIIISLKSSNEFPRFRVASWRVPVWDLIFPEDKFTEFFLIAFATSSKFKLYLRIAVSDNSTDISSFLLPSMLTISTLGCRDRSSRKERAVCVRIFSETSPERATAIIGNSKDASSTTGGSTS